MVFNGRIGGTGHVVGSSGFRQVDLPYAYHGKKLFYNTYSSLIDTVTVLLVRYLPSRKLTWNLRIDRWKAIFLYNPVVWGFHVNLQGSSCCSPIRISRVVKRSNVHLYIIIIIIIIIITTIIIIIIIIHVIYIYMLCVFPHVRIPASSSSAAASALFCIFESGFGVVRCGLLAVLAAEWCALDFSIHVSEQIAKT